MSKFSNIYDIDGNIIRKAGEGRFTLEETEKLVDELTKKVQENPDNNTYKVYLNNAQKWLMKMYNEMSKEELLKRLNAGRDSINQAKMQANIDEKKQLEELDDLLDEFKKQYETGGEGAKLAKKVEQPMENNGTLTQEDMLVERDSAPTNMEEVIDATD